MCHNTQQYLFATTCMQKQCTNNPMTLYATLQELIKLLHHVYVYVCLMSVSNDISYCSSNIPYKQKIWLEKYLENSITNHFNEIKFGGSRVTCIIKHH